jgi:hypothetical protein
LQQGFADIAGSGARERDQSVDADLAQHPAADLGPAAHARRQVGARQQLAELQVALRGERQSSNRRCGRSASVSLAMNTSQPNSGLIPLLRAAEWNLTRAKTLARSVSASAGMPQAGGAGDGSVETDDAVGDRVLAVQAKVDERRLGHAAHSTPGARQQTPCAGGCDATAGCAIVSRPGMPAAGRAPERSGAGLSY